jgi:alpha-D-ribose 1-methylphosphonate 5-triphosphate synthase subunit PhnH
MTTTLSTAVPGFDDPVLESQRIFRQVLAAMSRPGKPLPLAARLDPPAPLTAATAAIALTLLDLDTAVWLDAATSTPEVTGYLAFHCGCPITGAQGSAAFALLADPAGLAHLGRFSPGDPEFPDRSTTVIVQVPSIGQGRRLVFRGPGIDGESKVAIGGLPADFPQVWADNHALFPQGVDLIVASPEAIVGLPRSIRVEA